MSYIQKMPIPIAGIALSMLSLGNLTRNTIPVIRPIFAMLSVAILFMIILKILLFSDDVKNELQSPVVAGAFAAFPMAIAILATYLPESFAGTVWYISLILHICYIVWFISKFCRKFNIEKVFPTWFVLFVGIVACSVSSASVNMQNIGKVVFYFGLISYVILLPLVIHRTFFVKNIPVPAQPTLAIFAAPASLLTAGYLNSFEEKNLTLLITLLILSIAFYIVGLFFLITTLKNGFFPSVSAYTFPLAISAVATRGSFAFFNNQIEIPILNMIATFQMYLALFMVIAVFIKYMKFIFKSDN